MFIEVGFIFPLPANVLKIFSLWLLFAHSLTWWLHSQMFSLSFFICSPQKAGCGACISFFSFFVLKLSVCVREWGPCLCICCIFIHLNLFIHLIALWMTMKFIFSSSSSSSSFKALLLHLVGNRLRLRLGRCCRRCYRWRFTFPFSISLYPIMHVSLKFMQDVCLFAMFIYLFILYILIFLLC